MTLLPVRATGIGVALMMCVEEVRNYMYIYSYVRNYVATQMTIIYVIVDAL